MFIMPANMRIKDIAKRSPETVASYARWSLDAFKEADVTTTRGWSLHQSRYVGSFVLCS